MFRQVCLTSKFGMTHDARLETIHLAVFYDIQGWACEISFTNWATLRAMISLCPGKVSRAIGVAPDPVSFER